MAEGTIDSADRPLQGFMSVMNLSDEDYASYIWGGLNRISCDPDKSMVSRQLLPGIEAGLGIGVTVAGGIQTVTSPIIGMRSMRTGQSYGYELTQSLNQGSKAVEAGILTFTHAIYDSLGGPNCKVSDKK